MHSGFHTKEIHSSMRNGSLIGSANRAFVKATAAATALCVTAGLIVGCDSSSSTPANGSGGSAGATAVETKGAVAKELKAPKGVLPPKGKVSP